MFEETVSIDLGASYTKVAFRGGCEPKRTGIVEQDAKILMVDNSPLIPSLAIHTRDSRQPWVFGWTAANMNPSRNMEVFQNWKADLFLPRNNKDSATAVTVAGKFFEWLRAHLESAGVNLKKCQTRVAMPAFRNFDDQAMLIARCMDLSGWDDPSLVLKVTEPRANVLGLFSEGRNVVGRNGKGELLPNYGRMFGQQNVYIQAARGFVLHGGHGNLVTIMVVDIGAFTTDIASLTFDVSDMSDGLSAIRQESYALGVINELDKPLFAALEERHEVSFSNLSFRDCEYLKRSLYNGTPYFLLTRSNGKDVSVELGDNKDMELVESITGKFAEAVLKKVGPFIDEQRPERVFLTGGGSLIQPIAAALKTAFSRRRIPVQDVQQDSVAFGAEVWRPWKDTGEGLQRLATSLGGANVIPQESASTIYDEENVARRRAPIVTEPPAGYRTCRCQGGNKDCCFCGGRGFCP
jgi:hypothetical protein